MAQLISFKTSIFDPREEQPNPINPIAGESVLRWIREHVLDGKYASTEPDAEDWGWYIEVNVADSRYLVGASGQFEEPGENADAALEWLVQVEKLRSLVDKLLGRNKMQPEDILVTVLVDALKAEPAFSEVSVEKDA